MRIPFVEISIAHQRVSDDRHPWIVAQVQTADQNKGRVVMEVPTETLKLGGEADEQRKVEMFGCVLAAAPLTRDMPMNRFEAVESLAATSFPDLQGI